MKTGTLVMCIDDRCGLTSGQVYTVNFQDENGLKIRGEKGRFDVDCFRLLEI